jgi:nucleotide-binding universal stress UspA family protein
MITLVLLAVDDSAASLAAARLAADLCASWNATLHVVAAAEPGDGTAPGEIPSGDADAARVRAAEALLAYVARVAANHGVKVRTELVSGEPSVGVLSACRAVGADLIVVGRSRPTGYGQPYIGSQARRILEFSDVPVLVVPTPEA